jgi:hypothetical protein
MTASADAEKRRDTGMALAVDKADRDQPMWSDTALLALEKYCLVHPDRKFLGEDVREWAEGMGIVSAPDNGRAWGAVIRKAASLKIIRKVGYAPSRSSNLSPKCLWRAA